VRLCGLVWDGRFTFVFGCGGSGHGKRWDSRMRHFVLMLMYPPSIMIDISVAVHLETVKISKKQNSSTAPVTLLGDCVGVDNTLLGITRDKSPWGYHPECGAPAYSYE
jgi:hypothetical protein